MRQFKAVSYFKMRKICIHTHFSSHLQFSKFDDECIFFSFSMMKCDNSRHFHSSKWEKYAFIHFSNNFLSGIFNFLNLVMNEYFSHFQWRNAQIQGIIILQNEKNRHWYTFLIISSIILIWWWMHIFIIFNDKKLFKAFLYFKMRKNGIHLLFLSHLQFSKFDD